MNLASKSEQVSQLASWGCGTCPSRCTNKFDMKLILRHSLFGALDSALGPWPQLIGSYMVTHL